MARIRIGTEPLTPAQKQARYRQRKKAQGLQRKDSWVNPAAAELKAFNDQWQEELRQEELKAVRKAGRTKEQSKYYTRGRIRALVSVGNFFIVRERPDIAKDILKYFSVTKEIVRECKLTDFDLGRVKDLLA
jgi:hypothetical protein